MDNILIEPDLDVYFSRGIWTPRRLVIVGFEHLGRKSDPITLQKYQLEKDALGNVLTDSMAEHLAPENFVDNGEAIGEAVDVYAMGVLIRQLVQSRVFSVNTLPPAFAGQMYVADVNRRMRMEQVLDYVLLTMW